jgi:hypothetical protein
MNNRGVGAAYARDERRSFTMERGHSARKNATKQAKMPALLSGQ